MSEDGEMWREVRKDSQRKRHKNREESRSILDEAGISYDVRSGGAHLIVRVREKVIDFWPGTGLWKSRQSGEGRGVKNLIKFVGEK